ncbi:hypothetical protein [Gemmata obscuriglobus]|uniref:Uncharacterized protein n=1 Tax=Gemmata obscuriglobus TaxID=114 RepID=A0A2Z3HAD2_9BACT|nr:hypothetical protein [Gemmata obscuriglobus]AWM40457.1 hypothetical protein C1280_28040 [Gemmata obscuriglobus]
MTDPGERGRPWLTRLLAGELPLSCFRSAPLPSGGRAPSEYHCAARAAACPDLLVVHADPAAGERFIFDLATLAADRVLVLSPNPGVADRIVEGLLGASVGVLRALGDNENPSRLPPVVAAVTSAALGINRAAQLQRDAAGAVAAAEARMAAFAPVAKAIARLVEVNESLARLETRLTELTARRDRVEADLRAETDTPFARALAQFDADHAAAVERRGAELRTAVAARDEKQSALEQARHLHAEALRKPGFLSRWFSGKAKPGAVEPADLEKQLQVLEAEAAALAAQVRELEGAVTASATASGAARDALVTNELASRRAAAATAVTEAEAELARARAESAALNKVIVSTVPGDDHGAAQAALAAAREKAAEAARAVPVAPPRVVVGTPGSLKVDPVFAAPANEGPFGLLVLDRAEELTENEFPWLARLAGRYVLVGHAVPADDRRGRGGAPPFAARLARVLDRETWAAEGNRLVCRLVAPDPEQRRRLVREPLADRPEIELRFLETGADPQLAEITFPWNTPVADAKRFLAETLGEVRLRPCGEFHWETAADAVVAVWPAADGPDGAWVELEPGVREKVTGAGPFAFTAAVRFDVAAGWDAERAAAWLDARLPGASSSRFAALPRSAAPRQN